MGPHNENLQQACRRIVGNNLAGECRPSSARDRLQSVGRDDLRYEHLESRLFLYRQSALGNWFGGEFPQDQLVGLWDDQGDLLASTAVSNGDAAVGSGSWKFHSIDGVSLVAGHTYVVGGQGGAYYTGGVPTVTIDPRITYGTDLTSVSTTVTR